MNNFKTLVKTIIADFKESFEYAKQLKVGYKVNRMKRKADKLRETEGTQMFVVRWKGKIRIISKRWFKEQRQKGVFPKNFTAEQLKGISFYYTRP